MKKVFVILLLVMAAKAYSIDIKAKVFGGFNFMTLTTSNDGEILFGGLNSGKGQIEAKGERGSFGGWLRLGYEFEKDWFGDFDIWWRQSEKMAFFITYNDDGHFALDNIAGWNFFAFPGDVLGLDGCAGSRAFYSGFTRGAFFNFNPVKPLEINWGLNMFQVDTASYMLKSMTLQLVYDFDTKGKLGLTYEGGYMTNENLDDNPNLSLYYNLASIENVDIDIGASYQIWDAQTMGNTTRTRYYPLYLGVGAEFPVKNINFKTRVSAGFLGKDKVERPDETVFENPRPFDIGFDFLPSYSFKENIKGCLNAGFGLAVPDEGDTDFLWRINPYLVAGDEDFAAFYAGISLHNTALEQKALFVTISIGLSISF